MLRRRPLTVKNQGRHFAPAPERATIESLAISAHPLMRGFDFSAVFPTGMLRAVAIGLAALLVGSGFAPIGAHASLLHPHHHHRQRYPRQRSTHPAARRPKAHHGSSRVQRQRRAAAKHHRAGLEPIRQTTRAQIASLPLERFPMLPPLRGSHESLLRQNQRADREGLPRIADNQAITALFEAKRLAPIPVSRELRVDPRLPPVRRYCRPWTASFLIGVARMHYAQFHRPLQVNSAVRTVDFQRSLRRRNGNAAPAEGDFASPHLTGAAVDIGKRGLSPQEIAWMRAYLLPLQSAGKLDVEEEFQQACFHIAVYPSDAWRNGPPTMASAGQSPLPESVLLASRLP